MKSEKQSNFKMVLVISLCLILINLIMMGSTGCALSRQFIGTHGINGYGPGYSSSTQYNEWDFLENTNSNGSWISENSFESCQTVESLVEISVGNVPDTGADLKNINVRTYPEPLIPRGIFTTGTGIIVVVDLYD